MKTAILPLLLITACLATSSTVRANPASLNVGLPQLTSIDHVSALSFSIGSIAVSGALGLESHVYAKIQESYVQADLIAER